MATHSSVLGWRIPGTGEPGGLPSMGSHRVKHDWRDLAAAVPLLYCFLYKQECHSICCGRVFLSRDLNVYVFYLWHLIPYIRIFEKLAKKHLSELGIRAKVLGWPRWIFHSIRIKPCQLSSPHTWYFPGRYQRYFCQTVSLCSPGSECYILEPPYLSYRSSLFCSHSLSFRCGQYNWL